MAGGEDQTEQIVAEVVVEGRGRIGSSSLASRSPARQLLVLLRRELVAAWKRSTARRLATAMSQAAGLVWDALLRPLV